MNQIIKFICYCILSINYIYSMDLLNYQSPKEKSSRINFIHKPNPSYRNLENKEPIFNYNSNNKNINNNLLDSSNQLPTSYISSVMMKRRINS